MLRGPSAVLGIPSFLVVAHSSLSQLKFSQFFISSFRHIWFVSNFLLNHEQSLFCFLINSVFCVCVVGGDLDPRAIPDSGQGSG